ncbi:DoxX family protein [Flammeovirga pacifica]|uniref:DoxX family protein n=1 Tax=Flammeovirga pacifica TaxID=915059 RepID=A0A1S1YZT2_FLAPC|nr:DoxX family protein [Flammeovirga pacifica]OHX66385.1 DoxX family protein [Flammeovirga pacifica]
MEKYKKILVLILKITIAIILVQTLRFKFTAHPDSVYIFTQVGMEPFGRIGIGTLELIASILILIPRTSWIGNLLTLGIIGGAILMHLTILGIEVNGDNGSLFFLAVLTEVLSILLLGLEKDKYPYINKYIIAQ